MTRKMSDNRRGAATAFIDRKLAEGRAAFSLAELANQTGLSTIAARNQLLRLGKRVVRVAPKQQFFLIVSPEHTAWGAPPPDWWLDDYFKWLGRPYYLALLSAAESYGSSPQAVQVIQIMTDRPCRPIVLGRIRVRFFFKRSIETTPTQEMANAHAPLQVSTPEATACDLVRYAGRVGGITRATETFYPMVPLMTVRGLRQALKALNETATAQRIGCLFESIGQRRLAKAVRDTLPPHPSLIALEPYAVAQSKDAKIIFPWRVRVDLSRFAVNPSSY